MKNSEARGRRGQEEGRRWRDDAVVRGFSFRWRGLRHPRGAAASTPGIPNRHYLIVSSETKQRSCRGLNLTFLLALVNIVRWISSAHEVSERTISERMNRETPRNAITSSDVCSSDHLRIASELRFSESRIGAAVTSKLHVFVGERVIFLGRFSILANVVVKVAICGTNLQFLFLVRISVRNSI